MRTILATIGILLGVFAAILLLRQLARILTWLTIAGFIAVVLHPAVDFLEHRLHLRRALAAVLVFIFGVTMFVGLLYVFIRPIVDQAYAAVDAFPGYVQNAREGRGAIGELVQRYGIEDYLQENQDRFRESLSRAGGPALTIARTVANTVAALLTILVVAFLMLLEGPKLLQSGLNLLAPDRSARVRTVAADCAKAVTGYMAGNLMISLIAGVSTFAFLSIAKVPFNGVLALWVAFADLIPLVGATLGAVPSVIVAFLDSTPKGIATLIFFIAYQQFENHVLQVTVMSRTVHLNPLAVLVSVLMGVELFGILGALLAIPVAGVLQVIVRDVYDQRRGAFKAEPTVGTDKVPMSEVPGTPELSAKPELTGATGAPAPTAEVPEAPAVSAGRSA